MHPLSEIVPPDSFQRMALCLSISQLVGYGPDAGVVVTVHGLERWHQLREDVKRSTEPRVGWRHICMLSTGGRSVIQVANCPRFHGLHGATAVFSGSSRCDAAERFQVYLGNVRHTVPVLGCQLQTHSGCPTAQLGQIAPEKPNTR